MPAGFLKFLFSKNFVVLMVLAICLFVGVSPSLAATLSGPNGVTSGDTLTGEQTGITGTPPTPCIDSSSNPCPAGVPVFETLIQHAISLIVPIAFVALLFMITFAGIRFIMSGGEQDKIKSAREIATWAVVGIAFLVLAWLILLMVKAFTGVDVLNFKIQFGP